MREKKKEVDFEEWIRILFHFCLVSTLKVQKKVLYTVQSVQSVHQQRRKVGVREKEGGEEKGIAYFRSPCHVGVVVARTDGRTKKKK